MKTTTSFKFVMILVILLAASLSCNLPMTAGTGKVTPNVTQAYQTVGARLTQAAALTPVAQFTSTPQPTVAAQVTQAPPATAGPTTPATTKISVPSPTSTTRACDMAAAGSPKIDVTIDDNTKLQPGQSFNKIWRLQNSGTCTWSKDYSAALFSGEPMDAPVSVPVPNKVAPGESVDISVNLVAPTKAGTYTGNWKLRNADGTWFGIGPSGASPFWVKIVVAGDVVTPGITVTATTGPTPTGGASVGVQVSGGNSLAAGDTLDLDSNALNSDGPDIAYSLNAKGRSQVEAVNGALLAVFGTSKPSYNDCKASSPGSGTVALRNVNAGTFLCYRTDMGALGWLKLVSWTDTGPLNISMLTWTTP
jgi:hypothetical protein